MTVCKWAQNLLENSYSAGEEDDSEKEYHLYQTRSYFVKKNNNQQVNGVIPGKITK